MSNDAAQGGPRLRIIELVTRAEAGTAPAVLRARVRGTLGPYLTIRYVILALATFSAWFAAARAVLQMQADPADGNLAGPIVLGVIALVLTLITGLIAFELVFGQPIHALATELRALDGRVPAADLDRFEIIAKGDRAAVRAVRRNGRRLNVALGIDTRDARALVGLLESVIEPTRRPSPR
ncbi:MAG: hypothetical protein HOW73_27115 [Polyangiaceae bacterium]|nr:hypothetical protein [Polyangiaceae bacterium]